MTDTPWARHHSGFTRVFEETVAWLTTHTSKSVVSEFMRLNWRTVGEIYERVYKDLKKQAPSRFDGLVNIGIDETSYKKGHKYITVVMNHDTFSVVWCGLGYGQEVLSEFFQLLTPAQRASIRCVSADGAKWIASCVEKYCPNAVRCADPFHVVSWATEALETVRRQAWSESHKTAKAAKKRGSGRPRKGEQADTKKEEARSLKNMRFVLLRNPESLSENQKAQLEFLTRSNPVLYRAFLLKEGLRLAVHASADEIGDALRRWMSWAQRCRIPEFRKLRMKIKRHFTAIVAAAEMGITNARMEAINNKIKLVIRAAYGFRNMNNMLSMIMMTCSSVRPRLPGR